jgi:hypothetical protein
VPHDQHIYLRPNQIDTFDIEPIFSSIGQINAIDLFHDGTSKDDFWSLRWLDIQDLSLSRCCR